MLDIGRIEVSLDDKRRDLTNKVMEGRAVIASLRERHTAMGRKIDDATVALHHLENQLEAMKTVMGMIDGGAAIIGAQPIGVAASATERLPVAPSRPFVSRRAKPEAFKPLTFMKCLTDGHHMTASRSTSGYMTCTRCRYRRPI